MPTPHKHAILIKAWADGAQIQFWSSGAGWADIFDPAWGDQVKYRVKPANLVQFCPVTLDSGCPITLAAWSVKEEALAHVESLRNKAPLGILRIEFNHDTLDLVSATMEKV